DKSIQRAPDSLPTVAIFNPGERTMRGNGSRNAVLWMLLAIGPITLGCYSHGANLTPVPTPPSVGIPKCTAPLVDTSGGPVCGLRVPGADQVPPTGATVDAYLGI